MVTLPCPADGVDVAPGLTARRAAPRPLSSPLHQLMDLPARRLAFIIFFSFANGPLGWSVSLLQNRLGA